MPTVSYVYCPLLGLPTLAVHALYKHQHATSHQSKTGLRACNTLPGAACSPAAPLPCSTAVHTVYFFSSNFCTSPELLLYIYIILKLPQLWWHFPLPGRRNFVLVHHSILVHHSYSCTTRSRAPLRTLALLCTRAPLRILVHQSILSCTTLVHHSYHNLVHYSCTTRTVISCTTRAPLRNLVYLSCTTPTRAPLVLVHHSVLLHNSVLVHHSVPVHHYSRVPTIKPTRCPTQEGSEPPPWQAHNSGSHCSILALS